MDNTEFDALEKEMFTTYIRRHPIHATYLGLHEFDIKMPSGKLSDKFEEIKRNKRYLKILEKIDDSRLSPDRKINRKIALHGIRIALFWDEEMEYYLKDPDAVSIVGDALFPLFALDFAPLERRLESIRQRLERTPLFLSEFKERVRKPVRLWTEMGIESANRMPEFVNTIIKTARETLEPREYKAFERTADQALMSIHAYEEFLKYLLPRADEPWILGVTKFRRLLELRELGFSLEDILKIGEDYLASERKNVSKLAKKMYPRKTVEETKRLIKGNHPKTFEDALKEYRKAIESSRKFVEKKHIATLPKNEKLIVQETPSYLRHVLPFAAYFNPPKFDKKQTGIYVVTPPESTEMMTEHNFPAIKNTSVHEGYPGHHLQLTCANSNPSLLRLLYEGPELVEGWAHYCEEYMREKGYDKSSEMALIQSLDVVWRACRIIIDIKLCCGYMGYEEAINFLVDQVGMERSGAVAEVKRYTQSPTYQLSYLLGKHMIKNLKEKMKKRMGRKFSDIFFHDTILYAGSVPIVYLEQIFEERANKQ